MGLGKKKYLIQELGLETVEFMKGVKKAIDPLGLFNPGKVGLVIVPGFSFGTNCLPQALS